ncbi:cytidylate kinase family protein [Trichlorobacter lovleyi]|uniref:Transport-associated protein n=1 Tax=Trichlorobacter lovleyi (strain ATCC BAA-1151 / DSM 17278 / SZ) TaxID=398767 RepID=B3E7R4_TRIL1|nr:cytidylate kinase family protein [Trichlorobacter lovleyi]ACD95046.1 transport-associated protein [Trichlorobacter lovleyi SZ]
MPIITISREMGTGAYGVAKELAKKLKYTLVDGPKLAACAAEYGLSLELLQAVDEKPPSYNTVEDRARAASLNSIELILLDLAKKGNVILYGRGGQDLLQGCGNVLRLRFVADFEERVERFAEREWIDPDLAQELIRRSDHQRGGFIHFYFDRDWNDPLGYDLTFNTSRLSPGAIIDIIVAAVKDSQLKEADSWSADEIENTILVKKIETALLRSEELEYRPFRIEVEDGQVTLSGYIGSEQEKKAALKVAAAIKGVESVVDNLHVVNYREYKEKC